VKKIIASFVTGTIIAGAAVTTVSADEYEVEKGDSLWRIANENDTSVENLVELNELDSTTIHPNQLLLIKNNEKYKVEKGDTLNSIANNHDVTVSDLKDWNELSTDLIVIGQELHIQNANINQENASESNTAENTEAAEETNTSNESSAGAASEASNNQDEPEGETFSVTATAYTAECDGCSGVTSTGVDLNSNPDAKVIAVDPDVIPLGSEVYVEGYGYATAADVGSAIKGNKIDIHVPTKDEAYNWGVRTVDVTIVE
jgi:3D (Asp-Asp-Asp) domain-containing protein/LysM repeat protein